MGTPLQTYQPPLPAHLDFDQLRERALARLQALVGGQWTDYNAHDPGVTLLEALCYALTDLGYRAGFPEGDWLAEGDGGAGLPGPESALPGPPVSAADWRRLLAARAGNRYVRLEAADASKAPVIYYLAGENALTNTPEPGARAIPLRGLLQALGSYPDLQQAFRGLGTDYTDPQNLSQLKLYVQLDVEVAPEIDTPGALRQLGQTLVRTLREVVEMPPRYQSAAERIAAGAAPETVYEGPPTGQGVPLEDGRVDVSARKALYVSDLVGAVAALPAVRMIREIQVGRPGQGQSAAWVLPLAPDVMPYIEHFEIRLYLGGDLALKMSEPQPAEAALTLPPAQAAAPAGRKRRMGRYHSVRHHLPAAYGLDAADGGARARQLSAYLLFFEQILANSFGVLGEAAHLFSPASAGWDQTAFRLLNDLPGTADLWAPDAQAALAEAWESPEYGTQRRLRLLEHWLARFGETLPRLPINPDNTPEEQFQELQTLVTTRRAFWEAWPTLGARRGLGCNLALPDDTGGVEQRIAALLGLQENERIYLVEHILLRPLPEDVPDERGYLLTHAPEPDPYSLQVTVVYQATESRFADPDFLAVFARTVREEIPAHLKVNLLGLNIMNYYGFKSAWQSWRNALADKSDLYRFRVQRDQIIDWLKDDQYGVVRFLIGWPTPILNLPVPRGLMAAPQSPAKFELDNAQPGVQYQLCALDGTPLPNAPLQFPNSAGKVAFETPELPQDTVYRIKAIKSVGNTLRREGLLTHRVLIRVGVQADNLGIRLDPPEIDYGQQAVVVIARSQAEVQYQLIGANGATMSAVEAGNSGEIRLTTNRQGGLQDDTEIRVRATRLTQSIDIQQPGLVYVRPNPGLIVNITNAVLNYNTAAQVTVGSAQAGISYRLRLRQIADHEIIPEGSAAVNGELSVALPDGLPAVRLDAAYARTSPAGWTELTPVQAPGGNLPLSSAPLAEDCWIQVQALKRHANGHQHAPVILTQLRAALLRPNPGIEAVLLTPQPAADGTVDVELKNAQPGVTYQLTLPNGTTAASPILYVPDTNPGSPRHDGIGNLVAGRSSGMKIGIDFVVGPAPMPASVRLRSNPLSPAPASLRVLARKVQTRLSAALTTTLTLGAQSAGRQAEAPPPEPKPRKPRKPRKS